MPGYPPGTRRALAVGLILVALALIGAWLTHASEPAARPELRELSLVAHFAPLAPPGLPAYMAAQPAGLLLVGDRTHDTLHVLNSEGKPIGTWGPELAPGESLSDVGGIAFSGPNVYVVDPARKRIEHLDPMGRWLDAVSFESVETRGAGALAIDRAGTLYLADTGRGRILVMDSKGELLRILRAPGTGRGQLQQPVALAFGPDGSLYVADLENQRIAWWDSAMNPAGEWALGFTPFGVAVDSLGRVFVPKRQHPPGPGVLQLRQRPRRTGRTHVQ